MLRESDANPTLGRKPTPAVSVGGPLQPVNGDGALLGEVNGTIGTKAKMNGNEQSTKKGKKKKPE